MTQSLWPKGARVRLNGLASREDLNGLEANVLRYDAEKGRYAVRVRPWLLPDVKGGCEEILIRLTNLSRCANPFDAFPPECVNTVLSAIGAIEATAAAAATQKSWRALLKSGGWPEKHWRWKERSYLKAPPPPLPPPTRANGTTEAMPTPRFQVGEHVMTKSPADHPTHPGAWLRALVTMHHYTHESLPAGFVAPYQLMLLDGSNQLIFTQVDRDDAVRRAPPSDRPADLRRFQIGELVECEYRGDMVRGVVTQHNYTHPSLQTSLGVGFIAPYQLRLLDGPAPHQLIYTPNESAVRRAPPMAEVPPRFSVGDRVEVKYGATHNGRLVDEWLPGWVTEHWYVMPSDDIRKPWTTLLADGRIIVKAPYQVRIVTPPADQPNDLVFIPEDVDSRVRRLPQEPPRPPLRFAVGARVECKMTQEWRSGTVVMHWYTKPETELRKPLTEFRNGRVVLCVPYQVLLDGHNGQLIYAPKDDDGSIRALPEPPPFEEGGSTAAPPPPVPGV